MIDALKNTNLHKVADCTGTTLLHIATNANNTYIMKYLIAMGADVNVQDIHGETPLMYTMCNRRYAEAMKILLDAKANIHIEDNNRQSSLSKIVHDESISYKVARFFFQLIKRNYQTIKEIKQLLTKVNCPMYYAVAWSDVRVIRSRLKAGCNVNDQHPTSGKTALHIAVHQSELEIVKILLKYGAKINERDYNNSTPLYHFNGRNDSNENIEILRILLSRGAVMYKSNYNGSMQINKILRQGVRKVVKFLMDHGLRLSKLDESGRTVVHYLAMNPNKDAIEELRGKEFPVDVHCEISCTPLQIAASASQLHNVEFLLEHGADINYVTEWNFMSPLLFAVTSSNAKSQFVKMGKVCVELLLRRGADPYQITDHRETVFDIIRLFDNYLLAQPILLHLAIKEFFGTPIERVIMKKIQSRDYFERRFRKYRKQVRKLDQIVISESVTLLKFIVESDKKIAGYARNDRVVERLVRLNTKSTSNSYCKSYLKKRITKAIRMAQMKKQAVVAVGKIINFGEGCYYNIWDRIVDYLDKPDVINVIHAKM